MQIRQLEAAVGTELLRRTSRGAVAWRADDERPVVRSFVELATSVARDGAPGA
jgi:hypothetical protein